MDLLAIGMLILALYWAWRFTERMAVRTATFIVRVRRHAARIRYGPSEPGWWHEPEAENEDQATAIRAGRIAHELSVLRSQR